MVPPGKRGGQAYRAWSRLDFRVASAEHFFLLPLLRIVFAINLGRLRTTALGRLLVLKLYFARRGYTASASASIHRLSISTRAPKSISRSIATRFRSSASRKTVPTK